MRQEIWESRLAPMRECAAKGMSRRDTAKAIGVSLATVSRYTTAFGIEFTEARGRTAKPLDIEAIRSLAAQGLSKTEIVKRLKISSAKLIYAAQEHGIEIAHGNSEATAKARDRADAMAAMYRAGKTLRQIGDLYSVTRERVRQIIKKQHGIVGTDGGQHHKTAIKRKEAAAKRERRCLEKYGCSVAQYRRLQSITRKMKADGISYYRTPIGAFCGQRSTAVYRGIEWKLKIWEWWTIWQESGHWEDRGRARDAYVMCRFGDTGAYEVGNVYIATLGHNSSVQPNNPYRKDHPLFEQTMAQRGTSQERICEVEDCGEAHYGHGFCRRHYERAKRHEPRPDIFAGASQ